MAAHLHTEPLRQLIGKGWIGPVQSHGREIVRRIFVTVRDRNWQETPPTQFEFDVDESARTVRLRARHTSELVDFDWQGELLVGEDARSLRFAFEGRALRDMEVCRLGLIVLHPVDAMVGFRIRASDGRAEQVRTIGRELAPQPMIDGIPGAMTEPFTHLLIEREEWGRLVLTFDGDSFELEDQRNWGDASFKSYCTPLRKGFPRGVKQGTSIAHSVDLQFTPGQTQNSVVTAREKAAQPQTGRVLSIGRVWHASSEDATITSDDSANWDYLHLDLATLTLATLTQALSSPGKRFEIALPSELPRRAMVEWSAQLLDHRDRIARVLLYAPSVPSAEAIEALNELLNGRSAAQALPIYAATRGYFVEFNRSVPLQAPLSGIAFPLTATVHSDDAETVMSNVSTVRDMAETARCLFQDAKIALAPLALYHPPSSNPTNLTREVIDRWLAATLRHAAEAGVASITLAGDVIAATGLRPGSTQFGARGS